MKKLNHELAALINSQTSQYISTLSLWAAKIISQAQGAKVVSTCVWQDVVRAIWKNTRVDCYNTRWNQNPFKLAASVMDGMQNLSPSPPTFSTSTAWSAWNWWWKWVRSAMLKRTIPPMLVPPWALTTAVVVVVDSWRVALSHLDLGASPPPTALVTTWQGQRNAQNEPGSVEQLSGLTIRDGELSVRLTISNTTLGTSKDKIQWNDAKKLKFGLWKEIRRCTHLFFKRKSDDCTR